MLDTLACGKRGLESATMRVAVLARYSSDMQDKRSNSDQFVDCRKFAADRRWTVVAEFPEEEVSGATPLHARPVLLSLMKRAEAGEFDVVLAEDLDRFARRPSVMHALAETLAHRGVELWTIADGKVSDLHVAIKGHMAADFLRGLAQKVRRGHMGRVREGRAPAGRPPYGYRAVKDEPGGREVDEGQAAIIRRVYEHYLAGVSTEQIRKALNEEGIPGPRGGPWTRATLVGARTRQSGILSNPLYAGRTVWNRRSQPKNPNTGKPDSRVNPADQWAVGYNPKLVIIEPETWEAVQKLRESRGYPHPRHHRRPKHLLSGLLYCGDCGNKLTVKRHTKYGNPYFGCMSYDQGKPCKNRRMVQGPEIERRVLAGLREKLLSPEAIQLAVETYREERARLAAERAKARHSTERELVKVRRHLDNIAQDIGEYGGSLTLSRELRNLEARERTLLAELPTTEPDIVEVHPQAARRYREIVEDLGKALAGPEPARARAFSLLRSLITRVVVIPTLTRTPVGLEVTGNLLALLTVDGALRRDATSQVASIAITA